MTIDVLPTSHHPDCPRAREQLLRADRERRGGEPEYDPARVEREARASVALASEPDRTEARGVSPEPPR